MVHHENAQEKFSGCPFDPILRRQNLYSLKKLFELLVINKVAMNQIYDRLYHTRQKFVKFILRTFYIASTFVQFILF